jgi:hypothetical protein
MPQYAVHVWERVRGAQRHISDQHLRAAPIYGSARPGSSRRRRGGSLHAHNIYGQHMEATAAHELACALTYARGVSRRLLGFFDAFAGAAAR